MGDLWLFCYVYFNQAQPYLITINFLKAANFTLVRPDAFEKAFPFRTLITHKTVFYSNNTSKEETTCLVFA